MAEQKLPKLPEMADFSRFCCKLRENLILKNQWFSA
jgi:hypothetical protein